MVSAFDPTPPRRQCSRFATPRRPGAYAYANRVQGQRIADHQVQVPEAVRQLGIQL